MHVLSRFRVLEPGGGQQSKAWHSLTARILFFFCFVFALRYILRWWHLGFPETHCQVTLQRVDGCQVGEGLRAPPPDDLRAAPLFLECEGVPVTECAVSGAGRQRGGHQRRILSEAGLHLERHFAEGFQGQFPPCCLPV